MWLRSPLEVVAPAPEPEPLRALLASAIVLVLVAGAWMLPLPLAARAIAIGAIALGAALVLLRARRRKSPMAIGWVSVDSAGIVRTDESGTRSIVRWDEPFGLTVLANEARGRAILAFTTPAQTRYLHVRMQTGRPGAADTTLRHDDGADGKGLLARAVTVADGDLQGDARVALGMKDAARVVRLVGSKSPFAFERIYLSDPAGGGVTLDGTTLRVGERVFDLAAPLEWRGFMFHEPWSLSGHPETPVSTIYQSTWIRQGALEVALVAPMPAELSPPQTSGQAAPHGAHGAHDAHDTGAQRAIVKDLRLMQSLPDSPPPRELRVAVERLFMLPLRRALDRAPRVSRPSIPARGERPAVQT